MMTVLALAAAYGAYRLVRTALGALAHLPRRNEDMVLF
jgi:hypothetical protein